MGVGEWFTARVSACGVFHIVYPAASEPVRSELRTLFGQLSHDDMPMVRRSAALNIGKFAATVEPQYLKTDILSFFKDLTNDGEHNGSNCLNAKLYAPCRKISNFVVCFRRSRLCSTSGRRGLCCYWQAAREIRLRSYSAPHNSLFRGGRYKVDLPLRLRTKGKF